MIASRRSASRTILFDLSGTAAAIDDWPPDEAVRSARLLLIDHFGMEGMLRAARIARAANVPIIADFEAHQRPEFPELLSLVDHLLVPASLAAEITGGALPADACRALWSPLRKAVVVTCGSAGCWSLSDREAKPLHVPAFSVPTFDTTGCGDVFRGVYAAGLAAGLPVAERLRHAAAAAALLASRPFDDAAGRLPSWKEIEAFLVERTNAH